ncbi:hypothetical protein [Massilia phosphatilytica]
MTISGQPRRRQRLRQALGNVEPVPHGPSDGLSGTRRQRMAARQPQARRGWRGRSLAAPGFRLLGLHNGGRG